MSGWTTALIVLAIAATGIAGGERTAAEQYEALVEEYSREGQPLEFVERFLQLAEAHPRSPVASRALTWVLTELPRRKEAVRALELLRQDHLNSQSIGAACLAIADTASPKADTLLSAILEESPHREVRAEACWHLAARLEQQALLLEQLVKEPELKDRVVRYYGREYGPYLVGLDAEKIAERRAALYERMISSFRDIGTPQGTMGDVAEAALFKLRHLSIGKVAPEIEGEDIFGHGLKLSDHRGKVVVLSFWGHW